MPSTPPCWPGENTPADLQTAVLPSEPGAPSVDQTIGSPTVVGTRSGPKCIARTSGGKFKAGRSGNPKGRPPKPKEQPNEVVLRVLYELVPVNVSGKKMPMTMFEAIVRSTLASAIKDPRASLAVVKLVLSNCGPPKAADTQDNDESNAHVLERFETRLLTRLRHEAANELGTSHADGVRQDDDRSDSDEISAERSQ